MEIRVIGQGYKTTMDSSVAKELIAALNDTNYNSFKCLVAFASFGGISALTPHILKSQQHIQDFNLIYGIDHQGTSKEALEELLAWGVNVRVYHTTSPIIFHPKVYLFKGPNESLAIIGSNNATEFGLSKNIECSLLVKYNSTDTNIDIIDQVESYFDTMFDGTDTNIRHLNLALINNEVAAGKVPTEIDRAKRHDQKNFSTGTVGASGGQTSATSFGSSNIASNTNGFTPRRIRRQQQQAGGQAGVQQPIAQVPSNNWIGNLNSQTLVTQIGGPTRWRQVNFPIGIFQNFFGATPGNNAYHIDLIHVDQHGNQWQVEHRQAVTVQSQNYRFEIGAAQGAYPGANNRPIGVFVRVAPNNFLYHLAMPNNPNYPALLAFLNNNYTGRQDHLKRFQTTYNVLAASCPNLPF